MKPYSGYFVLVAALLFVACTTLLAEPVGTPAPPKYTVAPDGDDSGSGQSNLPFKTISHAIECAKPGDTILVAPGVYRESLIFKTAGTKFKPITVAAQSPGTVIIDGADPLSQWTHDVGSKPIYTTDWNHDFFYAPGIRTHFGPKTDGAITAIGYAEQILSPATPDQKKSNADFLPLTQVVRYNDLAPGKFSIDYDAHKLSLWLPNDVDPNTLTILGSLRSTLAAPVKTSISNITLKGLIFRHAANFAQRQAVQTGDDWHMEDCTAEWCNAGGIGVSGKDVSLLRVTAQDNGQLGLGGSKNINATLQDCISQRNNYKGFSPGNEAGGGKFSATEGLRLQDCIYRDNTGIGLWLDFKNKNYLISGGSYTGNHFDQPKYMGAGIMIEISDGPGKIEKARFEGNSGPAIQIGESMKLTIQDNIFNHNYIDIRDMAHRDPYHDADIAITNNSFKETFISTSIGSWPPSAISGKNITIDQNTYDNSQGKPILYWGTVRAINTLDEAQKTLGAEMHGKTGGVEPR